MDKNELNAKDKIEIFLDCVKTTFIVVGGVIALLKFSDYVETQIVQKKMHVLKAYENYVRHAEYDPKFLEDAGKAFRALEESGGIVSNEYFSLAADLGESYRAQFHKNTNEIELALSAASVTGEDDLINENFCSDAIVIWAALGPRIIEYRMALQDETIMKNIETRLIKCGKFSKKAMKAYNAEVLRRIGG